MKIKSTFQTFLLLTLLCGTVAAQKSDCAGASNIDGVYRIDAVRSDQLYSVIENATTNIPYGDQQLFFIDLAVRLTPPDLLAIECREKVVWLGSSRAPRLQFTADGTTRTTRNADGEAVQSRIAFERGVLTFTSRGGKDNLRFTFAPLDGGRSLRVTRRISAKELIEPVIIQTVYTKIDETARWDVFGDNQTARRIETEKNLDSPISNSIATGNNRGGGDEAQTLNVALDRWIDSTNRRDIDAQMDFYMPQMQAYYLSRNASRNAVRAEKTRVFGAATAVDIRAAEPEIIFQENGQSAVMRFRKKYKVVSGGRSKIGEVVQELRWRRSNSGWKIFSERDIRVIN